MSLFILFFMTNTAWAVTEIHCTPLIVKAQNKNIVLPGVDDPHTSQIYFLHNVSKKSLWLDHPNEHHKPMSAGWSSFLREGKWSAISINRKNFTISCAEIQPGEVVYHQCAKTIAVCTPHQTPLEAKRKGSGWMAEDQTWEDLLKVLGKRAIKLK